MLVGMKHLHGLLWAAFLGTVATASACGGSDGESAATARDDAATDATSLSDATGGDGSVTDGAESAVDELTIDPTAATLTVTDPATPKTQVFKVMARVGAGAPFAVTPTWSLSDPAPGAIDAAGVYTTSNKTGGALKVTATYGGKSVSADLKVVLSYKVAAPGGPSVDLFDPGKTTASTDATKAPVIVYPAAGTMFPQNVYKILFQWKKQGLDAFEVKFESPSISVALYTKGVEADCTATGLATGGCWLADATTWAWLATSAAGSSVKVTVTGADSTKPGTVYPSKSIDVAFSKAAVPGAIYYWSTTVAGVRKATVSDAKPTNFLTPKETGQCVACHTMSRNGKRLGADVGGENLWVVDVGPTFPPPTVFKTDPAKKAIPNAWVTFSPDTKRVVSSAQGLLTLRDGDTGQALGKGTNGTIPLGAGTFGQMPDWAPDGKFLVFARSAKAGGRKVDQGSISLLEVLAGDAFGTPVNLVTSKGSGDNNYFPMFAPTSDWIAYGHSTGASEKAADSQLRLVSVKGGEPFELTTANTIVNNGVVATGVSNNQPTWAPTTDGGVLWIAFQSKRDYGFVLGPGSKVGSGKNQLWVAAIDVSKLGKGDPSFPAFRLPFQELTENNHRPFWAIDATMPPPGDAGPPGDAAPPDDAGVPPDGGACLPQGADCAAGGVCCEPYTCDVAGEFKYACK